jgi:ATP-dependent DNA helicase PIF1
MFKKAVQNHNASAPQQKATQQQQSHLNSFRHAPGPPPHAASRPLSTGSGNVSRHDTSPIRRTSGSTQGTKRTLSGQVKAPSPQEDAFEYPTLNISEVEADLPAHIHPTPGRAPPPPVMFDENDFDSDLDLDVEDPASKSTVVYPKLPSVKPMSTARDSGYGSIDRDIKEARSSQPIPWSSSPVEHFKTPVKQAVQPTKRRHLPWAKGPAQTVGEVDTAPEDEAEEEEVTAGRPQKRRPTHGTDKTDITPLPKDSAKNIYPWNTTASAVKQQQKNLREANKKLSRANEGTEDEMKKAMAKKNKNTVHSIFLSEEQQQILNMVVENKKSVFFTGSAGK